MVVDVGVGLYELLDLFLGGPGEYFLDDVVEFVFGDASGGVEFVGVEEEDEGGVEDRESCLFKLRSGDQGLQEGEKVDLGDAVLASAMSTKW